MQQILSKRWMTQWKKINIASNKTKNLIKKYQIKFNLMFAVFVYNWWYHLIVILSFFSLVGIISAKIAFLSILLQVISKKDWNLNLINALFVDKK